MTDSTTEDEALFKAYMKGVRPLSQDQHITNPPRKKFKKVRQLPKSDSSTPYKYIYDPFLINQDHWIEGEETAHFHRDGISEKTLKLLKAGKLEWSSRLDLHHHTASHAIASVDNLLNEALAKHIRCVLIIHGKGSRTPDQKPILKNILIMHLRDNPNVLAYYSARPSEGGTGAMYVYLRSQKV